MLRIGTLKMETLILANCRIHEGMVETLNKLARMKHIY